MKKKMKRVEGSDALYRTESGSIVNTDEEAYAAYKRKREASARKEESIQTLGSQLKDAQAEIAELKDMLKKVLESK